MKKTEFPGRALSGFEAPPLARRIVYENERFAVINKLPGEAVEGASPGTKDLAFLLNEHYCTGFAGKDDSAHAESGLPPDSRKIPLTAVNRLDVPISGCCLFARTRDALADANEQFRQGRVQKQYWAIVEPPGGDIPGTGTLTHWLVTDHRRNKARAFDEPGPRRKKASLRYQFCGAGTHYLYLKIELLNGRHHQIRAQLERAGLHIKGDLKYGARRSENGGGIRLHAVSLVFWDQEQVKVFAEPPLRDRLWDDFMSKQEIFPESAG